MINQKEAIDILQAHIVTYRHQVTDEGWEEMVRAGIARNNIYDKLAYRADAEKQIQAYEMAIQALARGDPKIWQTGAIWGAIAHFRHR